ncbi:hypothetical protein TSOC_005102 [Tetrabaena socialis]|uniref:Uncharacterized protein n=1 Tax=Tetrabaena socialis TaxID=47790 RepID=A0A2J8A748_9CHLO|nr:hypothetical protein TSOC_005102 [Tetrabaena socialis]|eukprot:PNH08366.1 hypothetical protein TSOC_005102 [Tetrabaena socialis]
MSLRGGAIVVLLFLGAPAWAQQLHEPGHVAGGAHGRAGALLMQVEAHLLAIGTMQAAIEKTMAEIKAMVAPSAAVAAVAAQPAGNPQVWPLDPTSSFVSAVDIVHMNNGRSIREYPEVFAECKLFHKLPPQPADRLASFPCAQYVTNGSYMIVQDTKLDRLFNKAGPRKAARDFLAGNSNFVIDKSKELFLYTQHSDGYLLRVRPEAV